jgi:uncharacterized protein (UPF0216 family)
MKSVLIIGNVNSTFVVGLINNLKAYDPALRVDCLSILPIERDDVLADNIYVNSICEWWKNKFGKKVRYGWFLGVLRWVLFRKKRVRYDNIQIHFVDILHQFAVPLYKLCTRKLSAVIWGSDLMRCSNPAMLAQILNKCDSINCHTPKMKASLQNLLSEKRKPSIQFSHCHFGLLPFEKIKSLRANIADKQTYRTKLGLPVDKTIALIGYNADPGHQHIKVIEQLAKIQDQLTDVHFVLPITYGNYPSYIEQLKQTLASTKLSYQTLESYLSDDDVAMLRLSVDINIIVPITDAASGTVIESLFAGSQVITGRWLDYSKLVNAGVTYTTIDKLTDINKTLLSLISSPKDTSKNAERVASFGDWQVLIKGWYELVVD